MDPREALLRQDAKPVNKEVAYFSKIFQKNQPQRIYAEEDAGGRFGRGGEAEEEAGTSGPLECLLHTEGKEVGTIRW